RQPLRARLLDPDQLEAAIDELDPRTARYCHALSHVTMSPNVIHGGAKTNVVPDAVTLDVDIRTLPEVSDEEVDGLLLEVLDDLADRVEISPAVQPRAATASPTDTPMFDLLRRRAQAVHPGAAVLPWMVVGGTDAAFFRARGVPSYGAAMFSPDVSLEAFQARFHGHDERIDTRSLGLTAQLYLDIADGIADAAG
ncbi:MAG: M20/M25/M40 family metallo-hydrolase, partial [Nitriliruptoraceae bacterium]